MAQKPPIKKGAAAPTAAQTATTKAATVLHLEFTWQVQNKARHTMNARSVTGESMKSRSGGCAVRSPSQA